MHEAVAGVERLGVAPAGQKAGHQVPDKRQGHSRDRAQGEGHAHYHQHSGHRRLATIG